MSDLPNDPQGGQVLSARWLRKLLLALRTLPTLSAGPGLLVQRSGGSVSIALAATIREYAIPSRITEVVGATGDLASDVVYSARAIGRDGVTVTRRTPRYGRILEGEYRVRPAEVGDLCLIVRLPTDAGAYVEDLWLIEGTERLLTGRCQGETTTPGDGSGTGTGDGTNPPPPPPPPPPKDGGGPTDSTPDDGGTPTAGGGGGGTS